jgi:nucleoside-diphosphate-sugar epimerase
MKVLILGGTGVISRAIVYELVSRKIGVTVFNRGKRKVPFPPGVSQLTGDKSDPEEFERAFDGMTFDAVIDMISYNEDDARSTVRVFSGKTPQIVFCSTIAAYRRPYRSIPCTEDSESLADTDEFPYGYRKACMERYLETVMAGGKTNITVIRPSLTFGIGSMNLGVLRQNAGIIDRIRKGKPLISFGDGKAPWTFTFAPDLARGFAGVIGNSAAYNKAYHVTGEERRVWDDLYLEFGRIVGKEPVILHLPSEMLMKSDDTLFSHLHYEKSYAGVFDISKFKRDVSGFRAEISLNAGVGMMCDWYECDSIAVDPQKDALEDRLAAFYNRCEAEISVLFENRSQ